MDLLVLVNGIKQYNGTLLNPFAELKACLLEQECCNLWEDSKSWNILSVLKSMF